MTDGDDDRAVETGGHGAKGPRRLTVGEPGKYRIGSPAARYRTGSRPWSPPVTITDPPS